MQQIFQFLHSIKDYAPLFIRLSFGFHLMHYTYEDILFLKAGENYGPYLKSLHVPLPNLFAWLVLGIEFFGGLLLILGFKTRAVALPLIAIFIFALLLVHLHLPYAKSFEAIQMLAVSCFFLLNGSGKFSLDNYLSKTT